MENHMKVTGRWIPVLLLGLVIAAGGCGAMVAAGAGAAAGTAAGMAYSDRGAQSYVTSSVQKVAAASVEALRDMKINVEEREFDPEDNEIEIKAKDGDRDVVVDIEGNRDAGRTRVEVTVSENVVNYDRSRADQILRTILKRL